MRRFILGILFVVIASHPIQAYYYQREYRDEYTRGKVFIRVLANLTQVPDDIPDEAREVNLRYNMITDIPINTFSNLWHCRYLYLSYNEISVIESGMFNGLYSLTGLNLYVNSISALPEGAFTSLRSLSSLNLGRNNIQTVPANVFPNNVVTLFLNGNRITALKDVAYSNLVFLKWLNLNLNSISTIPADAFSTLYNCVELELENNLIENIEAGAFHGLRSLKLLNLRRNKLTTLDPLVLSPLPRPLNLTLDAQPSSMVCDIRLCWLKLEEEAESIVWRLYQFISPRLTDMYYPNCTGGVDWQSLQCPATTPCRDPAQVEFAQRSRSSLPLNNNSQPGLGLPYSTNSELRYTCESGYIGGGTITCQSNGQWTKKPECVDLDNIPCRDPGRVKGATISRYVVPVINNSQPGRGLRYSTGSEIRFKCPYNYMGGGTITCQSNGQWTKINECVQIGIPCRDPGDVDFAERSGSSLSFNNHFQPGKDLSYSTGSQLNYTCDPCYSGGGNITCQSYGHWTRKPECVRLNKRVVCKAPALTYGYLTPSFNQYGCGVKVTYHCNEGFTLIGPPDATCGPDGQFIDQIPRCKQNGSSKIIYGIVGGVVCGMILMALIGLTIFCFIRSKKGNRSEANTTAGHEASEAGYLGRVTGDQNGKQGNNLYTADPTAARGTQEQRVTGDGTVYNNTAYEDE